MKNPHKGSTLDSSLKEEHLLDQCETTAIKRVIAHQLERATEKLRHGATPTHTDKAHSS
jgi:hypothetical protein